MRGLILLIIALLIGIVILLIGFIYQLVTVLLNNCNTYFYKMAQSIDQLGNVVCTNLFNDVLIKRQSVHKFGHEDETISSVLGKNKITNTLTTVGKWLATFLNKIEKDHVEKAIE
jgi:Zn-dependent protease